MPSTSISNVKCLKQTVSFRKHQLALNGLSFNIYPKEQVLIKGKSRNQDAYNNLI